MSTDYVKPTKGPRQQPNIGATRDGASTPYGRRKRGSIAWGELEPDTIGRWVSQLCDAGYGIVLGKTSDGGALSVTILDGDKRVKDYPTSADDFDELVDWCAFTYDLPSFGKPVEPVPKKST